MTGFWVGFIKQASLADAAKKGIQAAKDVTRKAEDLGEYWKSHAADKLPGWKKKMIAEGRAPVNVPKAKLPKGMPAAAGTEKSIHELAKEELERRKKSLERGGIPYTTWNKALGS